jgi:hypothetical protein
MMNDCHQVSLSLHANFSRGNSLQLAETRCSMSNQGGSRKDVQGRSSLSVINSFGWSCSGGSGSTERAALQRGLLDLQQILEQDN